MCYILLFILWKPLAFRLWPAGRTMCPTVLVNCEPITRVWRWFSTEYDTFRVDSPALKYALHVSTTFTGDAEDVINGGTNKYDHNGMKFSAKDQDNDRLSGYHCARLYLSGWWYNGCYFFCPTAAVPQYTGFVQFGLAGSLAVQKSRIMMKITD